jgi:Lar family restriction alleviation protein
MIKYLDCPFCGGEAEQALYTHDKKSNGVAVRCSLCGGSTERLLYRHDDVKFPIVVERYEDCKAKAVKLWNKRSN